MQRWVKIGAATVGGLVAAGALAVAIGSLAWRRGTEQAVARLGGARSAPRDAEPPFSPTRLDALPPPVARYLAFALRDGQPRILGARIRWRGEFQLQPNGGWSPFTAEQSFTTSPPGFVWDAAIRMLPLVPMRVRDSYIAERAGMLGHMGGVAPIVNEGGTPEIAASALARWLGETAWFPTALLPDEGVDGGVRWEAIDDSSARATITDGVTTASAVFHFAPNGELTGMTAMRYRDVGGTSVLTPFEGRYWDYARREGVMIPLAAEVAWILPEGRFPYWRGQPAAVEYELARSERDAAFR